MNEKWSIGDGKNNAEWCVFKGGVCVASCSTEHGIFISEAQNIVTKMNEIESIRQQLAAALAACKLKDSAIQHIISGALSLPRFAEQQAKEALTIQPDDSALKAWLGGPVADLKIRNDGVVVSLQSRLVRPELAKGDHKLYSPKGLK